MKAGDNLGNGLLAVPAADFLRLIEAAESDELFHWCEICKAWIEHDDAALASTEDFEGCWFRATDRPRDSDLCRQYRGLMRETAELIIREAVTLPAPRGEGLPEDGREG